MSDTLCDTHPSYVEQTSLIGWVRGDKYSSKAEPPMKQGWLDRYAAMMAALHVLHEGRRGWRSVC